MKRLENKRTEKSESAMYGYKGFHLRKCQGYWFAFKDMMCFATSDGPTDTRAELVKAIDDNKIYEW
mgnify:CR=1 FL=1